MELLTQIRWHGVAKFYVASKSVASWVATSSFKLSTDRKFKRFTDAVRKPEEQQEEEEQQQEEEEEDAEHQQQAGRLPPADLGGRCLRRALGGLGGRVGYLGEVIARGGAFAAGAATDGTLVLNTVGGPLSSSSDPFSSHAITRSSYSVPALRPSST
jgi:hypothetical protein